MGIERLYSKSFHTLHKENYEFSLHKIHSMKSLLFETMRGGVLLTPGIKTKAQHHVEKSQKE